MPPVPPSPFYAQQPTNISCLKIANGNVIVTGDLYSKDQKVLIEADLTSYATTGFVTGVSGNLQTQISTLTSQTGSYVTGLVVRPSETGQFYPTTNPSGFITGVNLTSYATTGFVTGVSGNLQTQISTLTSQTGSYVTGLVVRPSETGQFYPTTNPSGFITSGEVSSALSGKSNTGHFHTMSDIIDLKSGVGLTTRVFLTGIQTVDRGQIIVPFTPFNLASNTNYKIEMHLPVTSSNGGITSGSFSGTASVAFKTYQSSNNITSAAEQGVPGIRSANLINQVGASQAHVWGVVRTSSTGTFLLNFGCDNSSPVGATASVRAGAYLEITEVS